MKHIIFLNGNITEEDVVKLIQVLSETRAIFSISTSTNSITIEGSNDVLHHVKQVILSSGYTIQ